MKHKRNRVLYAMTIIVVIILGLVSRKTASIIPDFLNTYLGDGLWALMIFIGTGFIFIEMKRNKVALIAISFCYLIELSQLYHANWIDGIRETALGGLVLGYGFLWSDLLAYAIGIIVGVVIEVLWSVIQKNKGLKMKKLSIVNFAPIIIAAPSILIGAMAMKANNIPVATFAQNIFCLVIAGLISCLVLSKKYKVKRKNPNWIAILISLVLLFLSFIDIGIEGVHRWVSIGPIKLYVSVIVLPIIIIELWKLLKVRRWWIAAAITITISTLLALQPDASLITSFSIPMIMMLWSNTNNNISRYSITVTLFALIVFSWMFLDSLPPVSYVEEIITLVADMGTIWLTLGIISLVILPLPFILFPPEKFRLLSMYLGLYFTIILISTLFGNFPVPLMGYGVSPIVGYFIAITWLVKSKINS